MSLYMYMIGYSLEWPWLLFVLLWWLACLLLRGFLGRLGPLDPVLEGWLDGRSPRLSDQVLPNWCGKECF